METFTLLALPRELIITEIDKFLVDIDRQLLRRVSKFFLNLSNLQYKHFDFYNTNIELIHLFKYRKLWNSATECSKTACNLARHDNLRCLRHVHECETDKRRNGSMAPGQVPQPHFIDKCICPSASAESGSLRCLKYGIDQGCYVDNTTFSMAARNGNLECLRYLRDKTTVSIDDRTATSSAANGHLDCLKYACENGFTYCLLTIFAASRNGHLDCVKYLCEIGCPLNFETLKAAKEGKNKECIAYLEKILIL